MKPTDPVPYSPEEIEESLKFWIAARASVVPMASVMPWPYPRRLPEALMAARRCATSRLMRDRRSARRRAYINDVITGNL